MTKEDLKEIIYDAQKGAMGCGCCADADDEREALEDAVEILWEKLTKLKLPKLKE